MVHVHKIFLIKFNGFVVVYKVVADYFFFGSVFFVVDDKL